MQIPILLFTQYLSEIYNPKKFQRFLSHSVIITVDDRRIVLMFVAMTLIFILMHSRHCFVH